MIEILPLPADLPTVAAVIGADPDGEIERAAWAALRRGDNIAACRLALTIAHPYRRAAYLQNFRSATIAAARATPLASEGTPASLFTALRTIQAARTQFHE